MNELDLPLAPPLPADVRERALRRVLAGTRPRRRVAPLVAAAAAVVTTVAVTASVALDGQVTDIDALAQPAPTPAPDAMSLAPEDMSLDDRNTVRACWRIAPNDGFGLPPEEEWRVTDVLRRGGGADADETAFAINDSFACMTGTWTVYVSDDDGAPVGAAEVTRLSKRTLVLLNPSRLPVEIDGGPASTAPVQLIEVGSTDPAEHHLLVPGSYDGPVPAV